MSKLKITVGDKYITESCNLEVVKAPVKNSVECFCNICNKTEAYSVEKFRSGKIQACKNCAGNIKIDDVYNESFRVTGFTIHNNTFYVLLQCIKCGKRYIMDTDRLKSNKIKCRCGTRIVANTQKTDITKVNKETERPQKIVSKGKSAKINTLLGCITAVDEARKSFSDYTIHGGFIEVGTRLNTSKIGTRVSTKHILSCLKCATIIEVTDSELEKYDNNILQCKECNKVDNRNILRNINWVGYTKNNMEVTRVVPNSDGNLIADIKCMICNNEISIPLSVFISENELLCIHCKDTPIKMICPLCGRDHIKTTASRLYRITEDETFIKCPETNDTISYAELAMQHESQLAISKLHEKCKGYTLSYKHTGRDNYASILVFKESYIGTDGETYFTCMCMEHNKMMVLTKNEIIRYNHKYCADTRMMPYNPKSKIRE